MPARLKRNAVAVLVLAAAFYWFFMFTKHDPRLSPIIPFGEDPYDAIGSFCMIVSILLALIATFRAFRPYPSGRPSMPEKVYLVRTQAAVALGVLITIASDGVAMARQSALWLNKPQTVELVALLAAMAAVSLLVLVAIQSSIQERSSDPVTHLWTRALLTTLASLAVLAILPAFALQNALLHFAVILLADALIAAPLGQLSLAIAPTSAPDPLPGRRWLPWLVIALLGIAVGAFALAGELFGEGSGGLPTAKMLLIAALFLGAGTGVMLIAYGFLGKPLGLFRAAPR
jgi:hypothetical protein